MSRWNFILFVDSIACTELSNFQFCFATTIQLPFILWSSSLAWPGLARLWDCKNSEAAPKLWFQLKHRQRHSCRVGGRKGRGGIIEELFSILLQQVWALNRLPAPLPVDRLDWARPRYSFEYEFKSNFDPRQKLAWRWSNWGRAQYVNLHNYANN